MPNKHAWENCLDLSLLPADKKAQTAQALNWLEKNFPEFNEMIYELDQGRKAGKINKIRAQETDAMRFDAEKDVLEMNFAPSFYLGKDAKIYADSLNELLVHELQHAVQKIHPGDAQHWQRRDAARARLPVAAKEFKTYLLARGVAPDKLNDYAAVSFFALPVQVRPEIINDPAYKKLAKSTLDAFRAENMVMLESEDNAMDRSNILAQMLGKSPRGSYADADFLKPLYAQTLTTPLEVYTAQSLESVRAHVRTWPISPQTALPPLVTGEIGISKSNIVQMQKEWDSTHNKNTRNISNDEWRIVEEAKAKYFDADNAKSITPAKKKKADTLVEKMKKDFNKTAGNDPLSPETSSELAHHGLNATSDKTKPKNWHLK